MSAKSEIKKLADFIMAEVDDEPSESDGAGGTAIRIIKELQAENLMFKDQLHDLMWEEILNKSTGVRQKVRIDCLRAELGNKSPEADKES